MDRRQFLTTAAAATLSRRAGAAPPTAPVAVARCRSYDSELTPVMEKLFDQLGGLGRLVSGKTVAIKVNLTGGSALRLGHATAENAHWTHPNVIGITCHLMAKAGARRMRILESAWNTADPLEEVMYEANWEPSLILGSAPNVEFENTNYLGSARKYSHFTVPNGGHLFPAYDLNHSYEDCDVFVSIAKMKEHATAGVTLAMKNCFGITPCTIYGDGGGIDEPTPVPHGGRGAVFHQGRRQPSKSSPAEKDPTSPRDDKYRIPRAVADLVAARPIQLSIVEAVESMAGGEGPWIRGTRRCRPGLIVAGLNPVTTDAVCMSLMGFDPMAERGTAPFELCDSTLKLAEELGVGTRDLRNIEVIGTAVEQVRFDFRKA